MRANKKKYFVIMLISMSLLLVSALVTFFTLNRYVRNADNDNVNLSNYVEVPNDPFTYEIRSDGKYGDGDYAVVTGFSGSFGSIESASGYDATAPSNLWSLTYPTNHVTSTGSYPVKEIDIPIGGSQTKGPEWVFSSSSVHNDIPKVGKVVVPENIEHISFGAFNGFVNVEYMQLPFVGTTRGNVARHLVVGDPGDNGVNSAFLALFGDGTYSPMSTWNLRDPENFDENDPTWTTGSDGTTQWYYHNPDSGTDISNTRLNVPVRLKEVYITDEYLLADRAFYFIPTIEKISVKFAPLGESDAIGAYGIGERVFDTCVNLKSVVLPNQISSYGEGIFCQCFDLETVKLGSGSGLSYTEVTEADKGVATLPLESIPTMSSAINYATFYKCYQITTFIMPHSVSKICRNAFDHCTSLKTIKPSNNQSAEDNVCTLNESLKTIEDQAFRNCTSLEKVIVPSQVESIGALAFNHCTNLYHITLPFIGKEAGNSGSEEALFGYIFGKYGDTDAGNLSDNRDTLVFQAVDGNPDQNRDQSDMTTRAFFYIPEKLREVVITNETVVASGAFMNCKNITSLEIVDPAGSSADSKTTIGSGALGGCVNLENLSIPFVGPKDNVSTTTQNGVDYMFGYIFGTYQYANMTNIMQGEIYSQSVTYYLPSKLRSVALTHQTILNSHSFYKVPMIEELVVGEATKRTERSVFTGVTNLTKLTLPFVGIYRGRYSEYQYWSYDTYIRNSLIWLFSNIYNPGHYENVYVTSWTGRWLAYVPEKLTDITITDETYYHTYAFRGFASLHTINILSDEPRNVSIEEAAMYGCSNLENLNVPFIGRDYNPQGVNNYCYTLGWFFGRSNYANSYIAYQYDRNFYIPKNLSSVVFGDSMIAVASGAFRQMTSLVSVRSNATISSLGSYAFAECTSLSDVNLPNANYTYVGNYAFMNDVVLSRIADFTPSSIKEIGHGAFMGTSISEIDFTKYSFLGDYAFANCLQLRQIDMTNAGTNASGLGLTYVGNHLFDGCKYLTDVTLIPDKVSKYMFRNCLSLVGIDLTGIFVSDLTIPEGFFDGCENLRSENKVGDGLILDPLSSGITSIGAYAFRGCKSLIDFTLPETLVTIGNGAFQNCTGLKFLRIPRTVTIMTAGTDINSGVDYLSTGIFYGCDANKFYLEVFWPEEEWFDTWGFNWNCYFPVYIIGDQTENIFTYEYSQELKGYLINGLNMVPNSAAENPIDFAPNGTPLLSGTLTFPATHDGLRVYGIKEGAFAKWDGEGVDYQIVIKEGFNTNTVHPFYAVKNFVLGRNFVYLGKNVFNFENKEVHFRNVYSQLTAVEAQTHPTLQYSNESYYLSAGVVYYKEAWELVGTRIVWNTSALVFELNVDSFTYQLGKEIKPQIVSVKPNDNVIKYPNGTDWTFTNDNYMNSDFVDIYKIFYPNGLQDLSGEYLLPDLSGFNITYSNNIVVGTGRIQINSNDSRFKGNTTLTFAITQYEIEVFYESSVDEKAFGKDEFGNPLSAVDHFLNIITVNGEMVNKAQNESNYPETLRDVRITDKEYDGQTWSNTQWAQGYELHGLPNGYTVTGRLETTGTDSGYYVGSKDSYLAETLSGYTNDELWPDMHANNGELIQYAGGFRWTTPYTVRDTQGSDVTRNFTLTITNVVYIAPVVITNDNISWPPVKVATDPEHLDDIHYHYQYTGLPIVPIPTVRNKLQQVLDPKFKVQVTEGGVQAEAIEPNPNRMYVATIVDWDHRNFRLDPNTVESSIKFYVIKADLTINFTVNNYVIGETETQFKFDFANLGSLPSGYDVRISGLGAGSYIVGAIVTSGWEKGTYTTDIPPLETGKTIYWEGDGQAHIHLSPSGDDITHFYNIKLNARVTISYNIFDYTYTITDGSPQNIVYDITGPDLAIGIKSFSDGTTNTEISYGADGYYHDFSIRANNVIDQPTISIQESGSAIAQPKFTIHEIRRYQLQLSMTKDRFEPLTKTVIINVSKGSYYFYSLSKEYDREVVDPIAKLARKPADFDETELQFTYYTRALTGYDNNKLPGAPSAIGIYKFTVRTPQNHSDWFEDLEDWPRNPITENHALADFEITKRSLYIDVVDDVAPYDSKIYDGYPWMLNVQNATNSSFNLLPGDMLTASFMSRSADIGIYDGSVSGDIIFSAASPWRVSNNDLGDQTNYYKIVYRGVYEIKEREMKYTHAGYDGQYDGRYHSISVNVLEPTTGYTIYYSERELPMDSSEWSIFPFYYTEPGIYTVYYKIEAPTYRTELGVEVVRIEGKTISYSAGNVTVHYDGYSHGIAVSVDDPWNATIYYAIIPDNSNVNDENLVYSTIMPTFTEIGVYNYAVRIEAPNYQTVTGVQVQLTIDNEGPHSNIVVTGETVAYDGLDHGPQIDFRGAESFTNIFNTLEKLSPTSVVVYYYEGQNNPNPQWIATSLTETDTPEVYSIPLYRRASTTDYIVTVKILAYGFAVTEQTVHIRINPLTVNLTVNGYTGTYDGQYHTISLTSPGTSSGDNNYLEIRGDLNDPNSTVQFIYWFTPDFYQEIFVLFSSRPPVGDPNDLNYGGYSATPLRYKDAGDYLVYYYITGENCVGIPGTATIHIGKNLSPDVTLNEFEYQYSAHAIYDSEVPVETYHDGSRIYTYQVYDALGNLSSYYIPNPKDLGKYHVTIQFAETRNCVVARVEADFEIVPRVLIIEYEEELEYNGQVQMPEVTAITNTPDVVIILRAVEGNVQPIAVGDYYMTIVQMYDNPNYVIRLEDQRLHFAIVNRKLYIQIEETMVRDGTNYWRKDSDFVANNILAGDRFIASLRTESYVVDMYTKIGYFLYQNGNYINNFTTTNIGASPFSYTIIVEDLRVETPDPNSPGQWIDAPYYQIMFEVIVHITYPPLEVEVEDPTVYVYDGRQHAINWQLVTSVTSYSQKFWADGHPENTLSVWYEVEAGTYDIAYEISSPNHESATGVAQLIILPATLDIMILPFDEIYDAQKHQVDFEILNDNFLLPPSYSPKHYYFRMADIEAQKINVAAIDKFFRDGMPATSPVYNLWVTTPTSMENAGDYLAYVYFEETNNWGQAFARAEVTLRQRPLYFNYLGANPLIESKYYDGQTYVIYMGDFEYDDSLNSSNLLPNAGLITGHTILKTQMMNYSFQTSSPDCRGEPDNVGYETPYQDDGDFAFKDMLISSSNGVNVAQNYYPVINAKDGVPQVQITIKRISLSKFDVSDNEMEYSGEDALPTIDTPSDGQLIYYYYHTYGNKERMSQTIYFGQKDVTVFTTRNGDVSGYYEIFISIKDGRNYYAWTGGDTGTDYDADTNYPGADYAGYYYKKAYIKVIPKNIEVEWAELESVYDGEDHYANPTIVDVYGQTQALTYQIFDANGDKVSGTAIKRAGNYLLFAEIPDGTLSSKNYTIANPEAGYYMAKRTYVISENLSEPYLGTNWAKHYTEEDFDRPEDNIIWLEGHDLDLTIMTSTPTAGTFFSRNQFSVDQHVTNALSEDVSDCFYFDLDMYINLRSNQIIHNTEFVDVVYDGTHHYPEINITSHSNGYSIQYAVVEVQDNGDYYNDANAQTNPEILNDSANPRVLQTWSPTEPSFVNVGRYRVFYRITVGGEESTVNSVEGHTDVRISIAQSEINFGALGLSREYDGQSISNADLIANVSGRYNGTTANLEFEWHLPGDPNPMSEPPVNVGTYELIVTSNADNSDSYHQNYTPLYGSTIFEITPRILKLTVDAEWEIHDEAELNSRLWDLKDTVYNNIIGPSTDHYTDRLVTDDALEFAITTDTHLRRTTYSNLTAIPQETDFDFLVNGVRFSLVWKVYYNDTINGVVKPDRTNNYNLVLDFNLVVHFPYIKADYDSVQEHDYSGTPYSPIITVTDPVAGYEIKYGDTVNNYDMATYEKILPGTYYVFFKITAPNYEDFFGTLSIVIKYKTRSLDISSTALNKEYDAVPYDENTRPTVNWQSGFDHGSENLPDPSTWKIEYYEALEVSKDHYIISGEALSSIVDAGTYFFRLTIPNGDLFGETVITQQFIITRRNLIINNTNLGYVPEMTYNGSVWLYDISINGNPDGYTVDRLVSDGAHNHQITAGYLVTTQSSAGEYYLNNAYGMSVRVLYNAGNDFVIQDEYTGEIVTKNYIYDNLDVRVNIKKADMVVITNIPVGGVFTFPGVDGEVIPYATLIVPSGYQSSIRYNDGDTLVEQMWTPEPWSYTNVGDYKMAVRIRNVPNYNDFYQIYPFSIAKAVNTLVIDSLDKAYDGNAVGLPFIRTNDYTGLAVSTPERNIQVTWLTDDGSLLPQAPKDVGTYKVRVLYPDTVNYIGVEVEKKFTISPLTVNIEWSNATLEYIALPQAPTFTLSSRTYPALDIMAFIEEGIDYSVTYYEASDLTLASPLPTKPTNVGSYIAVAQFIGSGATNFRFNSDTDNVIIDKFNFIITQRIITISYHATHNHDGSIVIVNPTDLSISNLPSNVTFASALQTVGSAQGQYALSGRYDPQTFAELFTWNPAGPKIIFNDNQGLQDSLDNYDIRLDLALNIAAGQIAYTVSRYEGFYDAESHTFNFTLHPDVGDVYTLKYSVDGGSQWQDNIPYYKDAMTSPVHVIVRVQSQLYGTVDFGADPSASDYDQFEIFIKKASSTLNVDDNLNLSKVYDAVEISNPRVSYNFFGADNRDAEVVYKYYWLNPSTNNYEPKEIQSVKGVGQYRLDISLAGSQNYEPTTDTKEIFFEITVRKILITFKNQTKEYDGYVWRALVSNRPSDAGNASDAVISSVPGISESGLVGGHYFTASIQTISANAGFYKPQEQFLFTSGYRVIDSSNNDDVSQNYEVVLDFEVTISKCQFDVTIYNGGGPYTGQLYYLTIIFNETPLIDVANPLELIQYTTDPSDDSSWTYTPIGRATGTTTVYIKIEGPNYETFYGEGIINIARVNTTVRADDFLGAAGTNKVYDGEQYPVSSINIVLSEGIDRVPYVVFYKADDNTQLDDAPTNAGNYYFIVKVDDDGIYAAAESDRYYFSIEKAKAEVTWNADFVIVQQGGSTIYRMIYTGNSTKPVPTAQGVLPGAPGNLVNIPLDVTITDPVGVDSVLVGTYSVEASIIVNQQDMFYNNYNLVNDTIEFEIQAQTGGILPGPGTDIDGVIPDPRDPDVQYAIYFPSPQGDPDAGDNPYTYGDEIKVVAIICGQSFTISFDQDTGEVLAINGLALQATDECNFKFILPADPVVLNDAGSYYYIVIYAELLDKVNTAWNSNGDTSNQEIRIKINPKVLDPSDRVPDEDDTNPDDGQDLVPEIMLYTDYQHSHQYTGSPITFAVTVVLTNGHSDRSFHTVLTEGVHYQIEWFNNTDPTGDTTEDMASFNIRSILTGGYDFFLGDDDNGLNNVRGNDAGLFVIYTDAPTRIKLIPSDSGMQYVHVVQDFDAYSLEISVITYDERNDLLDQLATPALQAKCPVYLGHLYQGTTIEKVLERIQNDHDKIQIFSATGSLIYDQYTGLTDTTAIVTTGMRIQLLDAPGGAAVDVLDMLLFGDLNGDGYINNNDSSMAFNYISNNSDYLSDDNDDTEYSLSYIAGLVKDVAYEADNVITGTPDINNNDVNAIFKHIEGEDININYYQASLFY